MHIIHIVKNLYNQGVYVFQLKVGHDLISKTYSFLNFPKVIDHFIVSGVLTKYNTIPGGPNESLT